MFHHHAEPMTRQSLGFGADSAPDEGGLSMCDLKNRHAKLAAQRSRGCEAVQRLRSRLRLRDPKNRQPKLAARQSRGCEAVCFT